MKKFILIAFITIIAIIYYKNTNNQQILEDKNQEGYLSETMKIKETAQKNINEAVEQENNKINDALMENQDLELVKKYSKAIIKTSLGDIEVEFFGQDSPQTVDNFLQLSQDGFYDGIAFHRVIKDFMIQSGDPLSRAENWDEVPVGTGGPGYKFADEFNSRPLVRGSLAMANAGPNTNGSQFFIVTAEATPWLNDKHTNFGQIVSGMEIIDKIENSETNEMDQPLEKILILSIELIEKENQDA